MGGNYYTTKQGDMWDYIAWVVYGEETYSRLLMEAQENKEYLTTYIFSAGVRIWCPYIEETDGEDESPDWRDNE